MEELVEICRRRGWLLVWGCTPTGDSYTLTVRMTAQGREWLFGGRFTWKEVSPVVLKYLPRILREATVAALEKARSLDADSRELEGVTGAMLGDVLKAVED